MLLGSAGQGDGDVSEEYRDHEGFQRIDQVAATERHHARNERRDDEGPSPPSSLSSLLNPSLRAASSRK
jgi:hypothetical protein